MRKILNTAALLFFITATYSQTTLNFCTRVEQNGYCVFDNNKFITTPDSTTGRIFMEVKNPVSLGTKLTYKIFTLGKSSDEKLTESIDQDIQSNWMVAWEPYNFPTNAKYKVKIFDDANQMVCSKSFELIAGSK